MIHPIVRWPDPVLAEVCAPIEALNEDVRLLAHDMLDTMYDAPGRGLAAPQVGVAKRLFVMDPTWKDGAPSPLICVNPEIVGQSDEQVDSTEGCLSIPGVTAEVTRAAQVELRWMDLDGTERQDWLDGFAALCAQHELDHLNGLVTFDRVDSAARSALVAEYESQL